MPLFRFGALDAKWASYTSIVKDGNKACVISSSYFLLPILYFFFVFNVHIRC